MSFGRYMSPPPQERIVSISSSERLLTSLPVGDHASVHFPSVLMTVSLPTSFPGMGELSKLHPPRLLWWLNPEMSDFACV